MLSTLIVTFESEEEVFIELCVGLLLTTSTIVATMYTSMSMLCSVANLLSAWFKECDLAAVYTVCYFAHARLIMLSVDTR